MQDWLNMSACDLGHGIAIGAIDPLALTETYLAAIEAHPLRDRIYARVTHDRALAEARAASERAQTGGRLSPLDGVPASWKDLFDTAGIVTEAGSALLKNRVPNRDAQVLQNATSMGLVCIGKTHMSELAFSGLGLNPVTATPPCVHDPQAISGGSSSGAAASVAFGLAPLAIGSDTGGSVRVPAAWNDLVGLKTTLGRLPMQGVVPLCTGFDTIGPLCRNVSDAALSLAALERGKATDLTGASIIGKRFLICTTTAFDDIRPEPLAAFEAGVERLRRAGAVIEQREIPCVADAIALSGILFAAEAYGQWKDVIEENPDVMFPEILARFRGGADVSAPDYVAAWQTLTRLRGEFTQAMAGYDAVIVPTSPILPPNIDRLETDHDYYVRENLMALRNTRIGNLMGSCAVTLPTGTPSCGIMLIAPPMEERALMRLGAAVEKELKP